MRASTDRLSGHIAVGLPPAVGVWVSAPIVEVFRNRWPAVALHIREGLSSSLQECLLDRRIDLAIVYNQIPLDAFDVRPLCSEAMVIVGRPDDTLVEDRGGQPLRIRDLAELPLIVPAFPHANRRVLEQAAVQHGVRLRVVLEVDSVTLTKALVRHRRRGFIERPERAAATQVRALARAGVRGRRSPRIAVILRHRRARWSVALSAAPRLATLRAITARSAGAPDLVALPARERNDS